MAPKHKSSDAGSASKPNRSRDILSISEKLKIVYMIEIERKLYVEIARLYGKNEFSERELMKNKEKNTCWFFCYTADCKIFCSSA